MNFFQILILSVVEGITEFLPVSSTGHLILTSKLLKIPQSDFLTSFEIIIQLGAIAAVIFLYAKEIILQKSLWNKLLVSFLPAAIIGLSLYKLIKGFLLTTPIIPVVSLIIGGIILILFEKIVKIEDKENDFVSLNYKDALVIGILQVFSIIPGVSRSAATIIGGMIVGLNKKRAAEYSFLLAIPTIGAASALDLVKSNLNFTLQEFMFLIYGLFFSFISAIIGIKFLIKFVEKNSFIKFGIYRIIVGVLFFLFVI